jgi:hypothetical protein
MIYYFKITSQESERFLLEAELDGEHTFFDFHALIQNSTGYEPYQLASFFLSDDGRMKIKEISMLDQGFDGGVYFIMQKTKLSDLLKSKGQKLFYTFDFINDRSFFIELTGIDMGKNLKEPLIARRHGDAPAQVPAEEKDNSNPANLHEEEIFMDFGVLDDYNELFGEMEDF